MKINKCLKATALKELVMVVKEKCLPKWPPNETIHTPNYIAAIKDRISSIISAEILVCKEALLKEEFKEIFEPIPHVKQLPTDVQAQIKLIDPQKMIKSRSYPCPQKYRDARQTLIQQHLAAGFIKPSSSAHASPAFIISKVDLTVLPCWVNDYRQLNSNMIMDSHPIPRIDDILNDCTKGKIWATIDMTNAFFQTCMHPDNSHLTAVSTPFGLYIWVASNANGLKEYTIHSSATSDICIAEIHWQDLSHLPGCHHNLVW